jgi:hypothetical protein
MVFHPRVPFIHGMDVQEVVIRTIHGFNADCPLGVHEYLDAVGGPLEAILEVGEVHELAIDSVPRIETLGLHEANGT